jgi:hypothetical protein
MKDFLQPVVETAKRPDPTERENTLYLRSFLFMRAMVGAIGVALPIVLVLVDSLFLGHELFARDSLSAYYYSGARDLFVGTLCATAIFLVTYKVFERNLDNTLSIVAGFAALAVALFPTGRPSHTIALTPVQDRLSEGVVQAIHFTGAGVFIASLGCLCFYFGVREGKRPARPGHRSPKFWRTYHWVCAGVIAGSLLFIVVSKVAGGPEKALLIGEALSVWAFGASWLMKGLELDILLGKPR